MNMKPFSFKVILPAAFLVLIFNFDFWYHKVLAQECAPALYSFSVTPTTIDKEDTELTVKIVISNVSNCGSQITKWSVSLNDVYNITPYGNPVQLQTSSVAGDYLTVTLKLKPAKAGESQYSRLKILQMFPMLLKSNEGSLFNAIPKKIVNEKLCVIVKNKTGDMDVAKAECKINMDVINPPANKNNANIPSIQQMPDFDASIGNFQNPIASDTVSGLIAQAIKILLALSGLSAVAVIAIAGFQLVVTGEDPTKRAVAIKSITWAIIGLILAILSFSIVAIVQRLIS